MNTIEITDKIKGFKIPTFVWILAIASLIVFVFIGYEFGTYNPKSDLITQLVDRQLKEEKARFAAEIKIKDDQLSELQKSLILSQSKYFATQTEIDRLRGTIINAKPPTDLKEIRKRLLSHGYPTF